MCQIILTELRQALEVLVDFNELDEEDDEKIIANGVKALIWLFFDAVEHTSENRIDQVMARGIKSIIDSDAEQ